MRPVTVRVKDCLRCGRPFLAKRADAKFCSGACRVGWHRSPGRTTRVPVALDLFCGAGGAGKGLQDAGFDVVGVDIEEQPDYPGLFIQGDALACRALDEYDLIWASPPCQEFSIARTPRAVTDTVDLIADTRALLEGHPLTVIENVRGAPMREDLELRGIEFGLPVPRVRIFELSFEVPAPPRIEPRRRGRALVALHGKGPADRAQKDARVLTGLPAQPSVDELQDALGIDHVVTGTKSDRRRRIVQAIPSVYAEWIGRAAMRQIRS